MTTTAGTMQVWYLLIDHENKALGSSDSVSVSHNTTVADLREGIKDRNKNDLGHVDLRNLAVWRCKNRAVGKGPSRVLKNSIKNFIFSEESGDVEDIDPRLTMEELNLERNEVLLVRIPELHASDRNMEDDTFQIVKDLSTLYKDTFIKVSSFKEKWKESDLQRNNIEEVPSSAAIPFFVSQYIDMLDRNPSLIYHPACDSNAWGAYDRRPIVNNGSCCQRVPEDQTVYGPTGTVERIATMQEVAHISYVGSLKWERFWRRSDSVESDSLGWELKERISLTMFFFGLMTSLPVGEGYVVKYGNANWPFKLIVVASEKVQDSRQNYRTYGPASDFFLGIHDLPHLLVEVNSHPDSKWPKDKVRMLMQGAATVRFANNVLGAFKEKKTFVLVAIFIASDGKATRYVLYQDKAKGELEVYYRVKAFNLSESAERVSFTRGLYNLVWGMQKNQDDDTKLKMKAYKVAVENAENKAQLLSLHSKRKRSNGDVGGRDNTDAAASTSLGAGDGRGSDDAELKEKGYEVISDVEKDDDGGEWGLLFKYPPNILRVHEIPNRKTVLLAKKVRKGSTEVEILNKLMVHNGGREHIISMIDSFSTPSATWAIFPVMSSIKDYDLNRISSKVAGMCWGLIKGLAYLHRLRIAHRDVKPDNLVIDRSFCLKIIDFDLAIELEDKDEEVSDYCGTDGWIAPEIETEAPSYSPIKSDRWACGRVLLYLLDEAKVGDVVLREVATKLEADDPQQRPCLLEWPSWKLKASPPIVGLNDYYRSPETVELQDTKRRKVEVPNMYAGMLRSCGSVQTKVR